MTTTVDARGKSCPMPIVLLAKAIRPLAVGDVLKIHADDRAFPEDVEAWCRKTGNQLVSLHREPGNYQAEIRKSG